VPAALIRSWPCRVQTALFDKLKEISPGLVKTADTLESLKKERAEIDRKIAEMEAQSNGQARNP
jgi:hypothetical protein